MENVRELFQILIRRIGLLNKNCCGIEGIDVSVVQSHILYEIDRRHQPSMQEIAEALGMDITTFSRQIQTLVEAELVKKTPYPEDRRVNILSLTEKGKRMADFIDDVTNSFYNEIFSHMTEFERETVLRSIKLLNESMAKSKRCCGPVG
ncbi:MarR family winged helix-turn-helix transcriptional regulator [Effusibacillus lacus]|uniref:MarR family transcriptional regulator n=1 Tax=Effusibacillus lacus TaxID=1348429 RepID=A0A292YHI2_9BACL|nr:MarR family winged helix-turn-helix transcriptional regulator [Effusibacillus lacus]TCS72059.1 DNA-binding MarR family transcriptional regulator [Effusibacillus lacus]GAX90347.1 MarR family transcriptional regulator [Effusibacillus lacus]